MATRLADHLASRAWVQANTLLRPFRRGWWVDAGIILGIGAALFGLLQVARDTQQSFVEVLATVKGAEMLGLVDTPQRLVRLTPLGQKFVRAGMEERKSLWRAELLKLGLVRALRQMAEVHGGELSREQAVAEIQQRLPREDASRTFDTLVNWARFGGLFTYREDTRALGAA
jgi:hypothetical protein